MDQKIDDILESTDQIFQRTQSLLEDIKQGKKDELEFKQEMEMQKAKSMELLPSFDEDQNSAVQK